MRKAGWIAILALLALSPLVRADEPVYSKIERREKRIEAVYNPRAEAAVAAAVDRNATTDSFRLPEALDILRSLPAPEPIKSLHSETQ